MAEIKVYIVKIIKGRGPGNWYNDYIGREFFTIKYRHWDTPKYRVINDDVFRDHLIDIEDAEIM